MKPANSHNDELLKKYMKHLPKTMLEEAKNASAASQKLSAGTTGRSGNTNANKKWSRIGAIAGAAAALVICVVAGIVIAIKLPNSLNTISENEVGDDHNSSAVSSTVSIEFDSLDIVQLTIEQEIEVATHIADASFVDNAEDGAAVFQIINLYKGEATDTVIRVYSTEQSDYTKGTQYLLLLEKNISVYYNYPKFVPVANRTISENDPDWSTVHNKIQEAVLKGFGNTVNEYGVPFTESMEIEEVVSFSTNIFIVTVKDLYSKSTILPVETYVCDILSCIKGAPESEGQIMITFFNKTVEPGKNYVVLTGDAKKSAPVYVLSSKYLSVFEAEKAEMITSMVHGRE